MTIKEYLDATGQTQKGFGLRIGLSEAGVSRLINRSRDPKFRVALKIFETTDGAVPFKDMAATGIVEA